ncbi:MAG: FtsQ-type POTRA domain-containing protein [Pseudomonadota bacterium]|nr:FtsQ-type POTRA domain-containing protein [Pseudomonadota bacterium]
MAKRRGASRRAAQEQGLASTMVRVRDRLSMGHLHLLGWLLLVGVVAYGGTWMSDPWSFPIETVTLEGELRQTDVAALRDAVTPYAAAGFFGVDVGAVRRAAMRSPWVGDASVIRRWPSTLVVRVVEREAAARWGAGAMLDKSGDVFHPAAIREDLPLLSGPQGSARRVFGLYKDLETAAMGRLPPLRSVELDGRGVLRLGYLGGPGVTLRVETALSQWQRFLELWTALDAVQRGTMQSADLRYAAGMAVRWQAAEPGAKSREQAG